MEDDSLQGLEKRLADPQTVAALNNLLDNAQLFADLLVLVKGLLANSENIVDNVASSYHEMSAQFGNSEFGQKSKAAAPKLAKVAGQAVPLLEQFADTDFVEKFGQSGLVSPEMLALTIKIAHGVDLANTAAQEERTQPPPGVIRLALMAKDPDVRRGMAFGMRIIKELGISLSDETDEKGSGK